VEHGVSAARAAWIGSGAKICTSPAPLRNAALATSAGAPVMVTSPKQPPMIASRPTSPL